MPLTLTEVLDNLYTTTWQNMKEKVSDQIFDATPFWFWLKDKGKMRTVEGGRFISEPLQFDKSDNVKWTGKGGTMPMNDKQILTIAKYDWRYLAGSIVRFGVDDQQNRGKNEIINFMNAKMENLKNALISEMETRLFGGSGAVTGSGTLEDFPAFDGLQRLVADDPTATADVGSIPQGTETWWRNKTISMSGESFATYGITRMRTMVNNTGNNLKSDQVDIIVTGQTPFEYYEDNVLQYYRTNNTKLGDLGFENINFKGRPMVWSPSCGSKMYFLNTNYIYFVYDPMMFFDLTEWKSIPNQINDRTAQIVTACQMTVARRRCQGVIHTITTQ